MVGKLAANTTKPLSIDIERSLHHFNDEFKELSAEWALEAESQAHLADQLYWQDVSQCFSLDSPTTGQVPSSWSSPNDFLNDGSDSNFDRRDSGGSLEGISARRRAQNRASQRAYRERRDRHVKSLEERLEVMISQHEELSKEYAQLRAEHDKVLENTEYWKVDAMDASSSRPTQTVMISGGEQEEKKLLVKVMICRKECCNSKFQGRF